MPSVIVTRSPDGFPAADRTGQCGVVAANRSRSPATSTRARANPAARSRAASVPGSTGTKMSSSCAARRSGVSSPSEPASTPPGRSTRASAVRAASCDAGDGMWCSIVRQAAAENRPAGNGSWVTAPATTPTLLPASRVASWPASARSSSTAVTRAALRRRMSVVSPGPGPTSSRSSPRSQPSSTQGSSSSSTRRAHSGLEHSSRCSLFTRPERSRNPRRVPGTEAGRGCDVVSIPYAGLSLDRATDRRADPAWVAARAADGRARVWPLWRDQCLVAGDPPVPVTLAAGAAGGLDPAGVGPAGLVLLGLDGDVPYFTVDLSDLSLADALARTGADAAADIRSLFGGLPAGQAGMLAYARGLLYWHRQQRYCGRCG